MNPTSQTPREAALRAMLQAPAPAETASPALHERVAQMARQADATRPAATAIPDPRRPRRLRLAPLRLALSGAVLTALAAIFIFVWPRVMSNQALAQINAAMARVSSLHLTRYRIEGGKRIKESETYFQGGATREERLSEGFTTLSKGGKRWLYNARAGTVTVGPQPVPIRGPKRTSPVFTLDELVRDFESQREKVTVTMQGQTTLIGRAVKRVLLQTKNDYETTLITLLVDVETDLPLRGEISARTRYGKTARWIFEMSYNRRLSASLFQPRFARTAKWIEQGRRDADLKTRLARGIAQKRVGERTLAIRELEVNRNGDVFLFYTAGKRSGAKTGDGFHSGNWFAGRDWKVFLSDSLGTRYSYLRYGTAGFSALDVQGQRLEADRWVPATTPEPGARWKPRTFFLNFEVNPKNLHGSFKQTFKDDYSARVKFQIPIDEAENTVMPPLADQLLHLTEEDIVKQASEERGELPPGVQPSPELVRALPEIGTWSPDSRQIATGIVGGVRVVNAESGAQIKVLRVPAAFSKSKVGEPLLSADGRILCAPLALDKTVEAGNQWFTWNLANGQLLGSWRSNKERDVLLLSRALSPDGTRLRLASLIITERGGEKRQWVKTANVSAEERDVTTGKVVFQRVLKHEGFVLSVEQSATNSTDWTLVTSQNDKTERNLVRAWDVRSGVLKQTFQNQSRFGSSRLKLARQAPLLAVGVQYFELKNRVHEMGESEIRLFDVATGQLRRAIAVGSREGASVLALSNDGTRLATRGEENKISIWNTLTGRVEQSLTGHGTYAYRMEFSPDGKWLQSVDAKEKTLLWHLP